MRRSVALITLLLSLAPLRAQGAPDLAAAPKVKDAAALLDLWVREQLEYQEIPGVAIGVVHGDDLVWTQAYGTRDLATNNALTAQTPFRRRRERNHPIEEVGKRLPKLMAWINSKEVNQLHQAAMDATLRTRLPL